MDVMCAWCHRSAETAFHALSECDLARDVWTIVGLLVTVLLEENDTILSILKRVFSVANAAQLEAQTRGSYAGSQRQWTKPPDGWIKINVDAARNQGRQTIRVGCVVRDDSGCFLRARTNTVWGRSYAREAEALSLKEALSWVKTWRTSKCIFESDAELLVDAIWGSQGRSFFDTLVEDCKELLEHFEEVLVVFVCRSANRIAHTLAQVAYSMSGPKEWYYTAPDFILCNLALEAV